MMNSFYIGLIVLTLICLGCPKLVPNEATTKTSFSSEINFILENVNQINVFQLAGFQLKDSSKYQKLLQDFPIKKGLLNIPKSQQKQLKQLIGNSNLYQEDGVLKKCYFTPEYGFEFIYKQKFQSDTAIILLSERCQEIKVFHEHKTQKEDVNKNLIPLVKWLNQLFSDDSSK